MTYNHEAFIAQAIDGFLMQETDFPVEIIIGEDCSTDRTRDIVLDYQKRFSDRIRVILSTKNLGQYTGNGRLNFIRNLKACRGKYIALCDGDDYWTDPMKLQKQVDFLEANPDYSLCFHNVNVIYDDANKESHLCYANETMPDGYYQPLKVPQETTDIEVLANGNYIHTQSVVCRNWIKNDPDFPNEFMMNCPTGDWAFHMHTARLGKIKYMPCIMATYRVHKSGIFSQKTKVQKQLIILRILFAASGCKAFSKNFRNLWLEQSARAFIQLINYDSKIDYLSQIAKVPVDTNWYNKVISLLNSDLKLLKDNLKQTRIETKHRIRDVKQNYEDSAVYRIGTFILRPFKAVRGWYSALLSLIKSSS